MGFTVETRRRARARDHGRQEQPHAGLRRSRRARCAARARTGCEFLKEEADAQPAARQGAKPSRRRRATTELVAALRPIVDERGSPGGAVSPPGTPLLQPTDERRRTGSHYTPRTLTEPIVRHALEPAFERHRRRRHAGGSARAESLRSGDGLRRLPGRGLPRNSRRGWSRPGRAGPRRGRRSRRTRTRICTPAAWSRSAASTASTTTRCAVDLARLSLWLATLARDHEFTFLDHALKCGDSLVGLTERQIGALTWGDDRQGALSRASCANGRAGVASARVKSARRRTMWHARSRRRGTARRGADWMDVRRLGDAVVATFFGAERIEAREADCDILRRGVRAANRFMGGRKARPSAAIWALAPRSKQPIRPFLLGD